MVVSTTARLPQRKPANVGHHIRSSTEKHRPRLASVSETRAALQRRTTGPQGASLAHGRTFRTLHVTRPGALSTLDSRLSTLLDRERAGAERWVAERRQRNIHRI